jgi:glycerate dehydrogenase
MKIVFLERGTFQVEFRRPQFAHEWIDFDETDPGEVVNRLTEAEIAIVNKLPLRAPALRQLPRLKLIAVAATGVDNIDLDYCQAHDIAVCNTRHYAGHSLPEHVLMSMLVLRRNLVAYRDEVRLGKWQRAKQFCWLSAPIRDLHGTTLGVVGYGFLGQAVAKLASAVGMNILVAERKEEDAVRTGRTPFEDVLASSDVITLHCPLTRATRKLIAEPELKLMKRNALLINVARGGLVDEDALLRALLEGWIAGAAVDVLSQEPPRAGNILLTLTLPNLLVTPHIAWASREAMQMLADQLVDNVEAFTRGEVANRVV